MLYFFWRGEYKANIITVAVSRACGVVKERTVFGAIAEIKNCMYDEATMIDLHVSCLESTDVESLRKIIHLSRLPVLAPNYNTTYERQNAGYRRMSVSRAFCVP